MGWYKVLHELVEALTQLVPMSRWSSARSHAVIGRSTNLGSFGVKFSTKSCIYGSVEVCRLYRLSPITSKVVQVLELAAPPVVQCMAGEGA